MLETQTISRLVFRHVVISIIVCYRLNLFFEVACPTINKNIITQAEADAINLLAGAKTQCNPENSVGVLSLAGKVPRVLVTPTDDHGLVLNSVHGISLEGVIDFPTGIQVTSVYHTHINHRRLP